MMVIGSLLFRRLVWLTFLMALAFILPIVRSIADDQIVKKNGDVVSGRIVNVADGQVMIENKTSTGSLAKFPIIITDIQSVKMDTPADVAKVQAPGVAPADVIAALEPQIKLFAGLPAKWVISAMQQLAEAYAAQGQTDRALATYNQIIQLYPGSAYINVAKAGMAEMSFKAGKIDEAFSAVQPIVEQANKDIAPSPTEGALYAKAFLVYGQALEAQKKPQQALEAYLTVKTMFYQNPTLVDQAEQLTKSLREHNPNLGVE